jgi:hypothetical protein
LVNIFDTPEVYNSSDVFSRYSEAQGEIVRITTRCTKGTTKHAARIIHGMLVERERVLTVTLDTHGADFDA